MSKRVSFVTLGCPKNEVDSAHMQKDVIRAGYELVEEGAPSDVVVINTCAFIQPAIEESIETIFDYLNDEVFIAEDAKLIVAGCLAARFGKDLEEELTEPDAFVPCSKEDSLVEVLDELFGIERNENYRDISLEFASENKSAYLKISEGCSRSCSYCTIPLIRGPYHSFSLEYVLEEAEELVQEGAKELVIIAQDSGLWGLDLPEKSSLAHLMETLAVRYPETWIRVMYLQPAGLNKELLQVMARYENICSYFDIPLQHCNESILKSMNRQGSYKEYLDLVEYVRSQVPDIVLRTTLIVGYPGETEEQFEELCDFVSEAEFDYVGIFPYSPEEGTVAANLPDQIDEETKMARFQELRDIADTISSQRIASRVDSTVPVLILGTEEDGQLFGRTQYQAPDVDGVIYVDHGEIGDIKNVTITGTLLYEMEGVCE